MIEGYALAVPLGFIDDEALGLDEGILLGSDLDEVIGSTLGATDGTEL